MDHWFVAELRKIPPITRFLCGSSLAVTISVLKHIVAPHNVLFVRELVMKFQVCCYALDKKKKAAHLNRSGDCGPVSF